MCRTVTYGQHQWKNLTGSWTVLWTSSDSCQKHIVIYFSDSLLHCTLFQFSIHVWWRMGSQRVAVPICVMILKTLKGQLREKKSLHLYLLKFCYVRWFSGLKSRGQRHFH